MIASPAAASRNAVFDLRSDFLSPPTDAMKAAIAEALADASSFGLREDARQQALEARAAELLGKEDALLFPTCTMANLVAVMAQVRPGEVVLAEAESHVLVSEGGGASALGGALLRGLPGSDGAMNIGRLEHEFAAGSDAQRPAVALVVVENTHNRAGGAPLPLDHVDAVGQLAAARGVGVHLDGSRLFNAASALGVSARRLAEPATTVAISLNKGLCAPLGAILAGPRPVIREAERLRQMLGGGFRPTGAIAAAGLIALDEMPGRIGDDHHTARAMAARIAEVSGGAATVAKPPTNIVMVDLAAGGVTAAAVAEQLAGHGVLCLPFGHARLRLCLHRGIGPEAVEPVASAFAVVLGKTPRAPSLPRRDQPEPKV